MIGILNIAQQAYSRYSHPPRAIPASLFMRNEEFNEVGNQILSDMLRESDTKENT